MHPAIHRGLELESCLITVEDIEPSVDLKWKNPIYNIWLFENLSRTILFPILFILKDPRPNNKLMETITILLLILCTVMVLPQFHHQLTNLFNRH